MVPCFIYQLYDEGGQVWFDIYEAPGIKGHLITAEVPRENQHPNTVRRHLLRKGAVAAALENAAMLDGAIATEPSVVSRAVRTGWRDGDTRFVSHRFVAGATEPGTVLPPDCSLVGGAGQLQACGTLKGWQDLVAVARHSTSMILALFAAFGGVPGAAGSAELCNRSLRPEQDRKIHDATRCGLCSRLRPGTGSAEPQRHACRLAVSRHGVQRSHAADQRSRHGAGAEARSLRDASRRDLRAHERSGHDPPSLLDRGCRGEDVSGDLSAVLGDLSRCLGCTEWGDARRRRNGALDRGAGDALDASDDFRPPPAEARWRCPRGLGEGSVQTSVGGRS